MVDSLKFGEKVAEKPDFRHWSWNLKQAEQVK
jgi:hypothetical protein